MRLNLTIVVEPVAAFQCPAFESVYIIIDSHHPSSKCFYVKNLLVS